MYITKEIILSHLTIITSTNIATIEYICTTQHYYINAHKL